MILSLSGKARKSLEAICDTFAPGEDGLPSASELGVPEAILMAVGDNPSETERAQFAGLLEAWDTQLAGTEASPFSSLSQAERERTPEALRYAMEHPAEAMKVIIDASD